MMEGEQFSLCWNNFHSNLSTGFHTLLKDEDLVDVTLAAEGRYLKAHKTVLSVCSPFFKELFRVNPCKHPIVVLQDVNYGALCSLLQFMYQGEVSVSQEEIPTFMRVAETLKVKGLTDNNNSNSAPSSNSSNGFENRRFSTPEQQNAMKKPRPVKKIIRPIQTPHMRPQEGPKLVRSPHLPPMKKPHLEELTLPPAATSASSSNSTTQASVQAQASPSSHHQQASPKVTQSASPAPPSLNLGQEFMDAEQQPLLQPKAEPIDEDQTEVFDENIDMSQMLDTTLSEPSPSQEGQWQPDFGKMQLQFQGGQQDSSSPGMVLLKSGRGQLVLIHSGHIYTLSEKKENRNIWVCVKKNTFNCDGRVTTLNGLILISYTGHNHPQMHDVIKKLQTPSTSTSPELTK